MMGDRLERDFLAEDVDAGGIELVGVDCWSRIGAERFATEHQDLTHTIGTYVAAILVGPSCPHRV